MGLHCCRHPCWHRALILFGTFGYWSGVGYLGLWWVHASTNGEALFWGAAAWLISAWLFKHLLQWRCQGREPSDGRAATNLALFLAGLALLTRNDND